MYFTGIKRRPGSQQAAVICDGRVSSTAFAKGRQGISAIGVQRTRVASSGFQPARNEAVLRTFGRVVQGRVASIVGRICGLGGAVEHPSRAKARPLCGFRGMAGAVLS